MRTVLDFHGYGTCCQDLSANHDASGVLLQSVTVVTVSVYFSPKALFWWVLRRTCVTTYIIYINIYIYIYNIKLILGEVHVRGKNWNCNNWNAFLCKNGIECEKVFHVLLGDISGKIAELSAKITINTAVQAPLASRLRCGPLPPSHGFPIAS